MVSYWNHIGLHWTSPHPIALTPILLLRLPTYQSPTKRRRFLLRLCFVVRRRWLCPHHDSGLHHWVIPRFNSGLSHLLCRRFWERRGATQERDRLHQLWTLLASELASHVWNRSHPFVFVACSSRVDPTRKDDSATRDKSSPRPRSAQRRPSLGSWNWNPTPPSLRLTGGGALRCGRSSFSIRQCSFGERWSQSLDWIFFGTPPVLI